MIVLHLALCRASSLAASREAGGSLTELFTNHTTRCATGLLRRGEKHVSPTQ